MTAEPCGCDDPDIRPVGSPRNPDGIAGHQCRNCGWNNCPHPTTGLQNFREPSEGDTVSQAGEVGLLADCSDCDETKLVRMDVLETMDWK